MQRTLQQGFMMIIVLLLSVTLTGTASAAAAPDYHVAYSITVADDGSALWRVEYRTLLLSDADDADFSTYAGDLQAVYLPQFQDLMVRSAAQAAVASGRHMVITGVTGDAVVQESPTGKYGVVVYTARWDGFAKSGPGLVIGDAFTGGMYLPRDATLTIHYPDGYQVKTVEPEPDRTNGALTWFGPRTLGIGQPLVVLQKEGVPLTVILPVVAAVILLVAGGVFLLQRKRRRVPVVLQETDSAEDPEPPSAPLSDAEIHSLEEQVIRLLQSSGGEMYQSEIVRRLGLPKSTVSSALNDMHGRGVIVKVKKGRENLIRLT